MQSFQWTVLCELKKGEDRKSSRDDFPTESEARDHIQKLRDTKQEGGFQRIRLIAFDVTGRGHEQYVSN